MSIMALSQSTELGNELATVVDRVRRSVVQVANGHGNGSGVIWRADGQIVTNSHVASSDHVQVTLGDGRQFAGQVVARHPARDIALITIEATDLPAAEIADSSRLRPGQVAIAVGHPLGYRDAATFGVLAAAGQAVTPEGLEIGDLLQADIAIAPGNSGGPLVDAGGRVIGINTMVAGRLAMAIPSNAVDHFVEGRSALKSAGYIGIRGELVRVRHSGSEEIGVVIAAVETGSPADRAGLMIGDIVLSVGNTPILDEESLPAAVMRLTPGEPIDVQLLRGGDPRSFTVVPTERP
jgi:serine protease Do